MSWQQWVAGPNGLVNGNNQVTKAGIYGHDGTVWAQSEALECTTDEIRYVVAMFSDASSAMVGGFMLSQDRYFYIREDTETGASHGVIHGRTGSSPVTIYKTAKAVVIGIGKPDAITGKIAVAVCKIGDSLSSFGL